MRTRPFALLLVLLVVVTSCQVSGAVDIDVAEDGSGTVTVSVTLDDQAQARVGDLETQLELDDLRDAGWTIASPRHAAGEWVVSGTKPFGSPDGLQQVLDEVGGTDGLFRGWTIELANGFGSTEWTVGGQFEFTGGLDQFGDADLTAALDGLPLGRTPEELAAELGEGGSIPLDLVVRVPGEIDTVTSSTEEVVDGGRVVMRYQLAAGGAIADDVSVVSSDGDSTIYAWFAAAALCVVLAGIVLVVGVLRRPRRGAGPPRRP